MQKFYLIITFVKVKWWILKNWNRYELDAPEINPVIVTFWKEIVEAPEESAHPWVNWIIVISSP